jgi:hypothetical protein
VHVLPVVHEPPPAATQLPHPGTLPSVHRWPVRGVHAVVLAAAAQPWQGLSGFTAPSARHRLLMRQPVVIPFVQAPPVRSPHVSVVQDSESLQFVGPGEHAPAAVH